MLDKKQLDSLLYSLSSFYRDFLPVDNQLMKMMNVYAKTIEYLWTVYGEAKDGKYISSARTLSTIPYFKVNIDDALYSLDTARVVGRMSFEDQVAYLDKEGLYTAFSHTLKDSSGEPVVYGMRLLVDFDDKDPLRLYEHYFLRSNRLYLLPKYIQERKKSVHFLHAFDIKYNDFTLEKNFGTRFSMEAGPLLPRYEYRDVIEAFIRSFQGNMTIRALKESILLATKWESFKVEDRKSPNISPRKLQLYHDWIISPNKFLVSLPEELIPDKVKVNIVRSLLMEIKEVQTDFMVFFDIERIDVYKPPMKALPTIDYQRGEHFTPEDDGDLHNVMMTFTENPMNLYGRYDSVFRYNWDLQYDDPPSNEIISIRSTPVNIKEPIKGGESVTVTYNHTPRIPRNFKAAKDPDTKVITFIVDTNQDGTTEFELLAGPSRYGKYGVIDRIQNDENALSVAFNIHAGSAQKRYYKARSKDSNGVSLLTLPIDISDIDTTYRAATFQDASLVDESRELDEGKTFDTDGNVGAEEFLSYLYGVPNKTMNIDKE